MNNTMKARTRKEKKTFKLGQTKVTKTETNMCKEQIITQSSEGNI